MSYKISVIVPVYNVEKYIFRCLTSIVNQTLKEIQIIVINDGSSDKSMDIIKKFEEKNDNFIVVDKHNEGLSATRNYGLNLATGKYISFIDSDDWIDIEMYEHLYYEIENKNADLIVCDYSVVFDNNRLNKDKSGGEIYEIEKEKNFDDIRKILGFCCNKLYKNEIIRKNKISFPNGLKYEDSEFNFNYFLNCKKIIKVNKPYLKYYQREDSITNKIDYRNLDNIKIFQNIQKLLEEKGEYQKYQKLFKGIFFNHLIAVGFLEYKIEDLLIREKFIKTIVLTIKDENLFSLTNNYIDLKSIIKYFVIIFKMKLRKI